MISSARDPGQKCVLFESSSSAMTPHQKAKLVRHSSFSIVDVLPTCPSFQSVVHVWDRTSTRIRFFDLWSTMLFHDSPIESFVSEKITITFQFEWWRPTNVTVIFLTWIEISSCDKYFITTKEWPRLLEAVIRTKIKLILSFVDREEFVFFSFFFVESSRYGQEILSFSDINNSDCDSFSMGLLLIAFFIISSNFIQFVMPGKFYGFWNKTKIKRERETLFSSKSSLKIF